MLRRNKLLTFFLLYGLITGFISAWWWGSSDNLFLPNVPGMLIGDGVYALSIKFLGNPSSAQAHYSIPWILRIPQIYVPVTIIFWGLFGLIVHSCWKLIRDRLLRAGGRKVRP